MGKRQNGGYGVIWTGGARGRTLYAHRVAFKLATGFDPIGKAVCHHCDNPPCCNPAHLYLGTIADNVRDMLSRGRHRAGRTGLRGEQIACAKVTTADVLTIRERAARGESSTKLGQAFGIDGSTVRQIVRRKIWAHVKGGAA